MKNVVLILMAMMIVHGHLISQESSERSRNIKSAGILIGSGIIGIDYEHRINDELGIQGGVGIVGFDASLNLHFSESVEGGYASLAYKSIGFGILNTIGPEYGHRWMFGEDQDWGIVVRVGLGRVVKVDAQYEQDYKRDQKVTDFPDGFLTYSIGICF